MEVTGFEPGSSSFLRHKTFSKRKFNLFKCKNPLQERVLQFRGVEGTRTPVQTYPSKAFYMFIPALLVGKQQETDEPIVSLAG